MSGVPLSVFLLARIAEDEEYARWGRLVDDPSDPDSATKILLWDHPRVLAECVAKREVVGLCQDTDDADVHSDAWAYSRAILRTLALVYKDHPDYRTEWAPPDETVYSKLLDWYANKNDETFEDELDAHIAESMEDPAYRAASRGLLPYRIYRLTRWVPRPIYWWYLDTFRGNNGWRPLFYRGRDR